MKKSAKKVIASILSSATLAGTISVGQVQASELQYIDPITGHRYVLVQGNFNRREAFAEAKRRGGYAVVFGSMAEFFRVMNGFGGFRNLSGAYTGHYQQRNGQEPQGGWVTVTGEPSAPLRELFNSNGPDDGRRRKIRFESDGGTIYVYRDKQGKNEDAAVIWNDNEGRLEDISANHRGSVLVEFNR